MADAVHGGPPERQDQHHGPRERGLQDQARHDTPGRRVPDLFQSWGGGGMAEQADAGLAQGHHRRHRSRGSTPSIPARVGIYQINGKQYGIPWNIGMVGVWYNKALFAKAGITAPPATWDDFLGDIQQAQGRRHHAARDRRQGQVAVHAPVDVPRRCASAARTRWPRRRQTTAIRTPAFIEAGEQLAEAQRAQAVPGRATWRAVGRRRRRGGHGRQRPGGDGPDGPVGARAFSRPTPRTRQGLRRRTSAGSRSRRSAGGAGQRRRAFGGGNGFAVGKDAPPEAIDFLKFFVSVDNRPTRATRAASILPVDRRAPRARSPTRTCRPCSTRAARRRSCSSTSTRPTRRRSARRSTTRSQQLFAGKASAEQVCQAITDAATGRLG